MRIETADELDGLLSDPERVVQLRVDSPAGYFKVDLLAVYTDGRFETYRPADDTYPTFKLGECKVFEDN